jgi:hypothetical protein
MTWKKAFLRTLWTVPLAVLALGPAPGAADPASITGTVFVYEDFEDIFPSVYIQTDDAEYLVVGKKTAALRTLDGKRVTAKGSLSTDHSGEQRIEVEDFSVDEE